MRPSARAACAAAAVALTSCTTSTGPVYQEYFISLLSIQEYYDVRQGVYVETMIFGVQNDFGAFISGAYMYYSTGLGRLELASSFSDIYGTATVVWTLLPSERFANPRPSVNVCANNLGGLSCYRVYSFFLR
ncbi:MAG TPA: hypothetical protein VEI06_08070 [Gemmatimonadaceae bacterium]|nr:hypothetical protein [Gemmatimonadaceae bacterium]